MPSQRALHTVETHSLHEELQQQLIAQFAAMRIGDKVPSDRELARRHGVAFLTVNKVMKQLELDGYVVRKHGSGTYLASYEKVVRRLGGVNGTIVIAYPDYFSSVYWTRVHLAHEMSLKIGAMLTEVKIYEKSNPKHLAELIAQQPDLRGILVDPLPGKFTTNIVPLLDRMNVPVVIFSRFDGVRKTKNVCCVTQNWRKSGYERARLLLEAGHRKLAYIRNEPVGIDNGLLYEGIKDALAAAGLDPAALIFPKQTTPTWEDARASGYALTKSAWERANPTGIIYDSVNGVLGGLKYFWERKIPVPEQVSMVTGGKTGNLEEYLTPPVTSVYSPPEKEMEEAFSHLLHPGRTRDKFLMCDVTTAKRHSILPPAK